MWDSLDDVDLGEVRANHPGNWLPDGLALEHRLRLTAIANDGLTVELHAMLTRYGFRVLETALLRAIAGWDVPSRDDCTD